MPSFNRRGFLQLLSAAGVAPLVPALPARALGATTGASMSKALWAGIYAKSGSATKFAGVARGMGLSNAAITGVGARSVGVRIAAATLANPLGSVVDGARTATSAPSSMMSDPVRAVRGVLRDVERAPSIEDGESLPTEGDGADGGDGVDEKSAADIQQSAKQ